MAMSADVLKMKIKERITDEMGIDLSEAVDPSALDIVIEEIIKHIQDTAEVKTQVGTTVVTAGVLTPPIAVASSGTGTQVNAPGIIE